MSGVKYREHTIDLKRGDRLFLYTDGVTEAENRGHELFGEERLLACLEQDAGKTPDEILSDVKTAIAAHVDGCEQFDDITMLCISFPGTEP